MEILFICMGNICRSPTAEGVFRHKVRAAGLIDHVAIDSAGTHNYHSGEPPDARSQHLALRRGYDLSDLRARALGEVDIERADFLVVMDDLNYSTVRAWRTSRNSESTIVAASDPVTNNALRG